MTIAELRPYQDRTVILRMHDGETATAKIAFVDDEYEDIIVDIIDTDRPQQHKGPISSAYAFAASDIDYVNEISDLSTPS